MPITTQTTKDTARNKTLALNAEFTRKFFLERFGSYEKTHPAYVYLTEMLGKMNGGGKKELILTRNWEDVNACALPNGTIFVSSKIFGFAEYKEVLEFVLRHEKEHIDQDHTQKINQEKDQTEPSWKIMLKSAGAARVAEYEADIRALLGSDKEGTNPYGAIVAAQKFADGEYDIEHGSPLVRLMNLDVM